VISPDYKVISPDIRVEEGRESGGRRERGKAGAGEGGSRSGSRSGSGSGGRREQEREQEGERERGIEGVG